MAFLVRPLDATTWADFARLADDHRGVWNGSYPEDTSGRTVSGSFLNNGTLQMFERNGFARNRKIGKHRWVVTR